MEHKEAIEMMAAERYLLDEMTPDAREAYEEHFFGCTECAFDVQSGAAFIDQSKKILPLIKAQAATPRRGKRNWSAWLRGWLSGCLNPLVAGPAFACLLALVGYQNLVVYPALQVAATEPRVLPPATVLHDATRGGSPVIHADLLLGSTIAVEVPTDVTYDAYKFEFFNSMGKALWAHTSRGAVSADGTMSIWLPGGVKQDTYKLVVSGITAGGQEIPVKQQIFDLQAKK